MTWRVEFHPLVAEEDLPALDKTARGQVLSAIRKKLAVDPESFGEPLRRELFGYRKLRVGDCRVIYKVTRAAVTVLVLKVGMRRDSEVYREMAARLKRGL